MYRLTSIVGQFEKLFYLERFNKISIKKINPLSLQMDNDREA